MLFPIIRISKVTVNALRTLPVRTDGRTDHSTRTQPRGAPAPPTRRWSSWLQPGGLRAAPASSSPSPRYAQAQRLRTCAVGSATGGRGSASGSPSCRRRAHCLGRGSEAQRSAPEGLRRRCAAAAWTRSQSPPLTCVAFSKCFSAAPTAPSPGRVRRRSAGRGQPSVSPGCREGRVLLLPCRISGAGWRNAWRCCREAAPFASPGPGWCRCRLYAVPGVWVVPPSLARWSRCRQHSCAGCPVGLTPHV